MSNLHDGEITLNVEIEYSTEFLYEDPSVGHASGGVVVTIDSIFLTSKKGEKINIIDYVSDDVIDELQKEIAESEQEDYDCQLS